MPLTSYGLFGDIKKKPKEEIITGETLPSGRDILTGGESLESVPKKYDDTYTQGIDAFGAQPYGGVARPTPDQAPNSTNTNIPGATTGATPTETTPPSTGAKWAKGLTPETRPVPQGPMVDSMTKEGWGLNAQGIPTFNAATTKPAAGAAGGVEPKPDVASQVISELNAMMESVRRNPANQLHGGYGLNSKAEQRLVDLAHASAVARTGLEGHRLAATERGELTKLSLAEKERHNKILEQEFQLKLGQQRDLAEQGAMQKMISAFGLHNVNPLTGEKNLDMGGTLANLAIQSDAKYPPALEEMVAPVREAYNKYVKDTLKGRPLTPVLQKEFQRRFIEHRKLSPSTEK